MKGRAIDWPCVYSGDRYFYDRLPDDQLGCFSKLSDDQSGCFNKLSDGQSGCFSLLQLASASQAMVSQAVSTS